jgi:hypothetical protein
MEPAPPPGTFGADVLLRRSKSSSMTTSYRNIRDAAIEEALRSRSRPGPEQDRRLLGQMLDTTVGDGIPKATEILEAVPGGRWEGLGKDASTKAWSCGWCWRRATTMLPSTTADLRLAVCRGCLPEETWRVHGRLPRHALLGWPPRLVTGDKLATALIAEERRRVECVA